MYSKIRIQFRNHRTRTPTQPHLNLHLRSTTMSSSDGQTLSLPDGRTLGYAEYGAPNGTPLLYFHGFPPSRLEASGLHNMASRRDIRLLSIDRPGFGLSTHDPHRRITDWPVDVQAFAAQVGVSRFAVLGVWGEGPYALACAKQLPGEKLSVVGVLAGAPVWDRGFRTKGVHLYARLLYLVAKCWPSGLKVMSDALVEALRWIMKRRIDGALEAMTKEKAANEKTEKKNDRNMELEESFLKAKTTAEEGNEQQELMPSTAQRRERLMSLLFEGFAQGASGFVHETRLLTRDWGFEFEDVT